MKLEKPELRLARDVKLIVDEQGNVGLWMDLAGDLLAANADQAEVLGATFASVFTNTVCQALCFAAALEEKEGNQHQV